MLRDGTHRARLIVPQDVKGVLGRGSFEQVLTEQHDPNLLQAEAGVLIAGWKAAIAAVRAGRGAGSVPAGRRRAFGPAEAALERAGVLRAGLTPVQVGGIEIDPAAEALDPELVLGRELTASDLPVVRALAGKALPLTALLDRWLAAWKKPAKTTDEARRIVTCAGRALPDVYAVTAVAVRKWVAALDLAPATANKHLSTLRRYFGWLAEEGIVTVNPFIGVKGPKRGRSTRTVLEPAETARLWRAAGDRGDQPLADCILILAYTGLRFEEACCLKAEDLVEREGVWMLRVVGGKTDSAERDVPVHSAILPVVRAWAARAATEKARGKRGAEGFLIAGLKASTYGLRSTAVGKRFGRLKSALGFPAQKVAHSMRHWVNTALGRAEVDSRLVNEIMGHSQDGMQAVYFHGADPKRLLAAIGVLAFPEMPVKHGASLVSGAASAASPATEPLTAEAAL